MEPCTTLHTLSSVHTVVGGEKADFRVAYLVVAAAQRGLQLAHSVRTDDVCVDNILHGSCVGNIFHASIHDVLDMFAVLVVGAVQAVAVAFSEGKVGDWRDDFKVRDDLVVEFARDTEEGGLWRRDGEAGGEGGEAGWRSHCVQGGSRVYEARVREDPGYLCSWTSVNGPKRSRLEGW